MVGTKVVSGSGQKILEWDQIFYEWRERHYLRLVYPLYCVTVDMIQFFSCLNKKIQNKIVAGRNIFKAISPRKFEEVLKPMPLPPSLAASKERKIFKPILPLFIYLRDRLPQPAPHVTSENSWGFFYNTWQIQFKGKSSWRWFKKIKDFALFCRINNQKLIDKNYVCGDIKVFCGFLFQFVIKEFVDLKDLFKRLCSQMPLEFLILFDFYRE